MRVSSYAGPPQTAAGTSMSPVAGRVWLLVTAAAAQVAAVVVVQRVFVTTHRGQAFDTAALAGRTIGEDRIAGLVDFVLEAMTALSLAAATIAIGFIALARGRVLLAAATTLLIVGANVTTQLLKHLSDRPDFGIDVVRVSAGNSLPSGHTTVAASVAVALVLVLPPVLRGPAALLGSGYAAFAGVATVTAGWHRPSDAVAALLVVGAWAAAVAALLLVATRRRDRVGPGPAHRSPFGVLVVAGVVALAAAGVAMLLTDRALTETPELLGRRGLLAAYGGGAAAIAGTAALVFALVLRLGGPAGDRAVYPGAGRR